ncbi:unnamed protein product [Brassica oleracea]
MDAMRKQLDVLMGANRNGDVTEVNRKYYDRDVCRLYLSGLCPHDLFQLTVKNGYPKVHSLQLRKAKAKGVDNYDRELEDAIDKAQGTHLVALDRHEPFKTQVECDRKIGRALKRLQEEDAKAAIAISVTQVTQSPEIQEADLHGNLQKNKKKLICLIDHQCQVLFLVSLQAVLLLEAFNKDRAALGSLAHSCSAAICSIASRSSYSRDDQ